MCLLRRTIWNWNLFIGKRKIEFLWDFCTMITVISPAAAAASSWLAVLFVSASHTVTANAKCECINLMVYFFSSLSFSSLPHACCILCIVHHWRLMHKTYTFGGWFDLTVAGGNVGKCNLMDSELQQWIFWCIFFSWRFGHCINGIAHALPPATIKCISLIDRCTQWKEMNSEKIFNEIDAQFLSKSAY